MALIGVAAPAAAASTGNIFTVAGTGASGSTGVPGPATSAQLNGPRGVAWMPDGGFLVAETLNERVVRVWPSGAVTTVAGSGGRGYGGDGGPATQAKFDYVHGVAPTPDGGFVIADTRNNRIRRVWPNGNITTVAGTGVAGDTGDGGPATSARIDNPRGLATTSQGCVLVPDTASDKIRRITPDGKITTVAGTGVRGFTGDGGQATQARLGAPYGVSPTADGGFLIAETQRVRRVRPDGTITTVAGNGTAGFSGDGGPATQAKLNGPHAVVEVPPFGFLGGGFLIADSLNNRVRHVSPSGTITTVAGTGAGGSAGDGGPAAGAQVYGPKGLSIRPDGHFLIAEFGPQDFNAAGGDRLRFVGDASVPDGMASPLPETAGGPACPAGDAVAPGSPVGLAATAGDGVVSLDWGDRPEGDLDGYDVYRSTMSGGPYVKVNGARVSASAYTDSGLSNGVTYFYVVRASDRSGNESANSNQASATPAGSAYRQAVLATAGLVSYWRLGEGSGSRAVDSKGPNSGTYFGPGLAQPGALMGDPDTSAGFDGSDDYVQVADFAPPANLSLEAWVFPRDAATGSDGVLVDKGNSEYDLRITDSGSLQLLSGNPVQKAVDDSFNFQSTANANRWYHVVVTFDAASDTVRFYRNGVLTKTVGGFTAQIQNTSFAFRIGRHSQFNFATFNGRLDEVALYNTALPEATVQQHYQAGTGIGDVTAPGSPVGLAATAGDGVVSLDWADSPEGDLDGYDVYRSTMSGGPYVKVNGARVSASAYTDSGVSNGVTYFYVVRASDRSGNESANSNQASATPAGSAYRQAVLATAGLVSYWRLGEGSGSRAVDSKGPNSGTYFGSALGQPGALMGDSDTSAGFDGSDDYVQVADFAPPASLSLEAWVYPRDAATANDGVLVDKGNSEYDLRITDSGSLQLLSGNPVQKAVDDSFDFQSAANADRWYHVVVTFDAASDTVRFYRNGVLTKTVGGFTAQIQNTSFGFRIGRHSQYNFATFNGRLDEVALYNTALPEATIAQHYQAGTG